MNLGESMKSARHLPLRQNAAGGGGGQGSNQGGGAGGDGSGGSVGGRLMGEKRS